MIEAYLMPAILLAVSPIIGKYSLGYVHPDIKTLTPRKKWAAFLIFGLAAYIPMSIIILLELITPIYSPLDTNGILFNYEGNAIFSVVLFLGIVAVNTSLIDFIVIRRKRRIVVGIPKHVIRYEIKKQIKQGKAEHRQKEINNITTDLKSRMSDKKEVTSLLDELRDSIEKERAIYGEVAATGPIVEPNVIPSALTEKVVGKSGEGLSEEEQKRKLEKMLLGEEKLDKLKVPESKKGLQSTLPDKVEENEEKIGDEEREKKKAEILKKLDEMKKATVAKEMSARKEEIIKELEEKIDEDTSEPQEKEKTQELLNRLKEKVKEDIQEPSAPLGSDEGIDEIARGLRELHSDETGKEDKAVEEQPRSSRRHHGRPTPQSQETGIGESVISYEKAYPKRRNNDILKEVVGDVRQQLINDNEKKESEAKPKEGKAWYDSGSTSTGAQVPASKGSGDVELFEDDIGFGDDMGGLEGDFGEDLEDDFGDLAGLEGMDEDLESGDYDGVFVDMEKPSNGCPNCGKTGTSIVYCSNCGKPLCSNCALSVEGSEEFIKYKCPHCEHEFAMKRRVSA